MNTTIYASEYAKLDSNVMTGGGTDDTEVLQGILDKALEWGRLKLVMDGAALVRGLKVHSNTTIECMNKGCGFFLADNSNCAVLQNAEINYEERKTHNVKLIGGTYNHNCLHQAHHVEVTDPKHQQFGQRHYTVSLEFIGVENLYVQDVTVRDQRTFAFTVGNFRHVTIEDTFFELDHEIPMGNQDGFHFWGPGQFLTVRNVGGKTEDDFMNIGPDERDGVSSITDVLIDGVYLDHAWQGIRLLSTGTGLLDRVTVRNVTGTYSCYGFYINPWFTDRDYTNYGGNFGNITFENIDLRPEDTKIEPEYIEEGHPCFLFSIGGDMQSMTFRNIHWYHPEQKWNIFQIGYPYHNTTFDFIDHVPRIRRMLIDGLNIMESEEKALPTEYIWARGKIDRLTLRDVDIMAPHRESKLLVAKSPCEIGQLVLDRANVENMDCLLDLTAGEVGKVHLHNIIAENIGTLCCGADVEKQ